MELKTPNDATVMYSYPAKCDLVIFFIPTFDMTWRAL